MFVCYFYVFLYQIDTNASYMSCIEDTNLSKCHHRKKKLYRMTHFTMLEYFIWWCIFRDDEHIIKLSRRATKSIVKIEYRAHAHIFIRVKLAILLSLWINITSFNGAAINSVLTHFYEINNLFHTLFTAARPIKRHFFRIFSLEYYWFRCFYFYCVFCYGFWNEDGKQRWFNQFSIQKIFLFDAFRMFFFRFLVM